MLSLDRIREEILDLMNICETNPERAESGIQEIFFLLMSSDQPFYLSYAEESPVLSPAATDEKNLYLRLFSHEEVADKYASRTGTGHKEHSLLDILQIGHWAFLGGAYGFILNEGDRWIRIPIPDFIALFFSRIYGDESLCDRNCIEDILFINEIRRNGSYHYGMQMGEGGEWTGNVQVGLLPPLTISSLFDAPTDILRVDKEGTLFSYSKETLLKALLICGYEKENTKRPSGNDYVDDLMGPPSFVDGKWRIEDPEDLALVFHREKVVEDSPSSEAPISVTAAVSTPVKEKKGILSFLRRKRKKPSETDAAVTTGTLSEEPVIAEPVFTEPVTAEPVFAEPVQELETTIPPEPGTERPAQEAVTGPCPEPAPPPPQEPTEEASSPEQKSEGEGKKAEKRRRKGKVWLALAATLAIILSIGGFFTVRHIQYKENLKNFRTYIAAQDYASAHVLYQDATLGRDADGYLAEEVDRLVLRYANNEISAGELSASLKALSNFPSISQELEIAKLHASKLEESKNAYVTGRETTDIYERLDVWRQVMQLDTVNYASVQQTVVDNEAQYVDVLRADIEYYRTRILDFAVDRVDVLSYWYPENEYVPALVKEFSSTQTAPLSHYPLSISDVRIRQESSNYWTLYVDWRNLSVKSIDSICFSVVALGEDGEIVTCEDRQGAWTIFDAMDNNRYEPEEEPSFNNYYWNGAFYGPDVRTVKLTAVNIAYRDGSTASYTSDVDLKSIIVN